MKIKEKLLKIKDFIKTNTNVIVPVVVIFGILIFGFVKDYLKDDTFISYFGIVIEAIFVFFVLKEFKMTKKSFEWLKEEHDEKVEKEIERKIKYFAWLIMDDFKNSYKVMLDKHKEKELSLILQCNEKILDIYCKDRAERYFLPVSFCKTILTSSIKQLTKQWSEGERIDFFVIYDYFIKWSNSIFTTDVFTPSFIKNWNKYFKSYKEINEIYEKLIK